MKKILFMIIILVFFISCEKDSNPSEPNTTQMGLSGFVQKGPFITGSTIEIQELNGNLSPNGNSFSVSTEDNFGSFSLESEISTDYIEIISTGFYFNEVSGEVTNTIMNLRTLSQVADTLNCNVNILTTLAKKRIVYLINEESRTYSEAKQQAQGEILSLFRIYESGIADFEDMDISSDSESDAILLAISAVLQGSNSVSDLSYLISTIVEDMKADGVLDDQNSKDEIYNNAKELDLAAVRGNIENRYSALGLSLTVPDFENYVNNIWKIQCRIVSPTDLSQFDYNDSVTVNIDDFASDINIINTKYYLDGSLIFDDGDYPYLNKFKLEDLEFGTHILKALATDDSSRTYSDSVTIMLKTPAEYTVISPADNERFNSGASVNIEISGQPDFIAVTNVKYYFDNILLTSIDNKQLNYNYSLNDPETPGEHTIKAVVTDETGRTASDSVTIVVNAPPSCSITKLQSTQEDTSVQSALLGQPLVMGRQGLLQTSASDTDGSVSSINIYLDGTLVNSNAWSNLYEYSWTISDTTKFHTMKVVVTDNEGETAVDSVNYELYGSKWIQTANLGQYAGGEKYAMTFNNKLWLYNATLGVFASSVDGINWTEVTNSLPWGSGGNLLQQEYEGKIWLLKGSTLWSSSDGVSWNSLPLVKEKALPESELFVYNNAICGLYLNNTYENESDWSAEVEKLVGNHFELVSSLNTFFTVGIWDNDIITNGNEVYIIDQADSRKTYYSSDCLSWGTGYGLPSNLGNAQYVFHDGKITAVNGMLEDTWLTSDGITWTKDYLVHPMEFVIKDAVVYNGCIWLFDDPGRVYCLKKYFD